MRCLPMSFNIRQTKQKKIDFINLSSAKQNHIWQHAPGTVGQLLYSCLWTLVTC